MKVLFFGGTGGIGQRTVRELSSFSEVQKVTLAARSREKYQALLEQLGQGRDKLHFLPVDLKAAVDFNEIFRGHDLIASTAGPFYKYEYPLARAALAAGLDYVSICDDFDAAAEVFTLQEEAEKSGCRVLTGIGWTPGLSNLMARAGADSLATVKKINIAWAGGTDDTMGMAVILHVLHIFSGRVPSWRKGNLEMVAAGSDGEVVSFPEPIGAIKVYTVGHPEPVTLGKYFPAAKEITLKGGINQELLTQLSLWAGKLHPLQNDTLRTLLSSFFQKTLPLWRRLAGSGCQHSGIRVDLEGLTQQGESKHLSYSAAGPMDILTGVPLAIAIREIARGNVSQSGVFAPEAPGALNPHTFFAELEKRGVQIIVE